MKYADSHCHILSNDASRYPRAPLGGKQSGWASNRPVTAEAMLTLMDDSGIDQAVLVQATTAYGYDNSYVIDSARRWPDRFVAVGTFDPLGANAGDRLTGLIDQGLSGVRLFTTGSTMTDQGLWFADEVTDEFWSAAGQAKIPVCLQLRLGPQTLAAVDHLLGRHPDVVVLLDHCGYPDVRTSPAGAAADLTPLAAYPALHLKLTHRTLEGLHDLGDDALAFLKPVLQAFSAQRVAWGSNCPAAEQPMGELVALADKVLGLLTAPEREDILGNTTRRLYKGLRS
jgi:predicted TIM-barrel fold metal-dependent hydrolase